MLSDPVNGDGRYRGELVANDNFNGPDQTPRQWSTGDRVHICCQPSSIQSLPLAQVCKGDEINWLERLYKLKDPRKEKTD